MYNRETKASRYYILFKIGLKYLRFVSDINFNNQYWQVFESPSVKMYLYGAYLDTREWWNGPRIRITAMIDKNNEKVVS